VVDYDPEADSVPELREKLCKRLAVQPKRNHLDRETLLKMHSKLDLFDIDTTDQDQ